MYRGGAEDAEDGMYRRAAEGAENNAAVNRVRSGHRRAERWNCNGPTQKAIVVLCVSVALW